MNIFYSIKYMPYRSSLILEKARWEREVYWCTGEVNTVLIAFWKLTLIQRATELQLIYEYILAQNANMTRRLTAKQKLLVIHLKIIIIPLTYIFDNFVFP